ncbi:chitinase 4 [Sphaerosporella brunnea]|uniref:chitinase n=1 Tax=Sphaerosporella brunnea TaxID=1250544 RepID=A0A5J5F6A0_9PEZI|nr:chitinase 4 [Sphaerosporella brunnea]
MRSVMKIGLVAAALLATAANAALDLTKRNNMVLYWGQNAHGSYDNTTSKQQQSLYTYCQDPNVDAISIGFLNSWNATDGGQPLVNFANSCTGYEKFPGTDLLWCPTIAADIQACQLLGKTILISIGGYSPTYSGFASPAAADAFAYQIWNMFGKGWSYYRPFGSAIVDGFDLDIEVQPSQYYEKFVYRLRKLFEADGSKKYYITAAPQCHNPDPQLDTALRKANFDAVFVQFYNNPNCAATAWTGKGGDQSSNSVFNFGMWDSWVSSSAFNKNMKVLMALPASNKIVISGYVSKAKASDIVADLARFKSFAGVAIWDASEVWVNTGYITQVKSALNAVTALGRRGTGFFRWYM